jgi:hypothetical protein
MIDFLIKFILTSFEGLILLTKIDKTNIPQIFKLYKILVINIIVRQLIIFKNK